MLFFKVLKFKNFKFFISKTSSTGRSFGRITVNHKSTGEKSYTASLIDYKREAINQLARTIYLIPRLLKASVFILMYEYGFSGAILAPEKLQTQKFVISSKKILPLKPGNAMPIKYMPVGSKIHSVDYAVRSAGTSAQVLRHKNRRTMCKLPSGKAAWFFSGVIATVGVLTNSERSLHKIRNAGYNILKGKRPSVRGTAMNPIDHPHGGGQGKTSGGRASVTPYGRGTKGYKTKRKLKSSKKKKKKINN